MLIYAQSSEERSVTYILMTVDVVDRRLSIKSSSLSLRLRNPRWSEVDESCSAIRAKPVCARARDPSLDFRSVLY
jgi:hypothetical protein